MTHAHGFHDAYTQAVQRRTTLNLDPELVARAGEVLGTRRTTDTVRRALEEAVRRDRLRGLTDWELVDLDPEKLEAMRRSRVSSDA